MFQGLDIGTFFPGFLVAAGLLLAKHRFGQLRAPARLDSTPREPPGARAP